MNKCRSIYFIFIFLFLIFTTTTAYAGIKWPNLPEDELQWIAEQIYQNESNSNPRFLTHWNNGEEFPSFGIGHFIWYPKGITGPFDESFPSMITFLKQKGYEIPELANKPYEGAPWSSKETFELQKNNPEMIVLRDFLVITQAAQFEFILLSGKEKLKKITASAGESETTIEKTVNRLFATPGGVYPIIDYLNFKGAGTSIKERYKNEGWGLLQVLAEMSKHPQSSTPITEFQRAAKHRLSVRVKHSPPERNEAQWIPGWFKRIDTYNTFSNTEK